MKIGIIDLCKQIEDPSMNRKKAVSYTHLTLPTN